MKAATQPTSLNEKLLRMLLIFVVAFCVHWAAYWQVAGSEMGQGVTGYFYGLELILFFGHVPLAIMFLTFAFMLLIGFPAILIFCALAPDRNRTVTVWTGLIVAIPLLLSTFAAFGVEAVVESLDRAAPTPVLDLDSVSHDAKRSGFVALSGWQQNHYAAGYGFDTTSKYGHTDQHSHLFAPVVDAGWTLATPVKYFVHFVNEGSSNDNPPAKVMTLGQWGHHLPLQIQWQMERKGLKIDPSYAVIEAVESDGDGNRADPKRRFMLLIGGLLVTVTAALSVLLFYGLSGRALRKEAAAARLHSSAKPRTMV